MEFFDFPPAVAKESAERANASCFSTAQQARQRIGETRSTPNVCCFKLQSGIVRPVYDLFKPTYPEGSMPGMGTVHAVLCFYPNDTHGYEFTATDFVPL